MAVSRVPLPIGHESYALENWAPETVDPETLARLRADLSPDHGAFNELIGLYIGELVPRLQAIVSAIEQEDHKRIAAAAHVLKGSSMLMGARALSELCLEIELAAKSGDAEQAAALLPLLQDEATRVARALAAA